MRKPNRDLLPGRPRPPVEVAEHDETVAVADELLGLGAGALEELADGVPELERLPRAPVDTALGQRRGEDQRRVGLEALEEGGIAFPEQPVGLADVVDVLSAQSHRQGGLEHSAPSEPGIVCPCPQRT